MPACCAAPVVASWIAGRMRSRRRAAYGAAASVTPRTTAAVRHSRRQRSGAGRGRGVRVGVHVVNAYRFTCGTTWGEPRCATRMDGP